MKISEKVSKLISKQELKKQLILNLPYVFIGLFATNLGEAWRLTNTGTLGEKIMSLMYTIPLAFGTPWPSFNPFDLLIGALCGAALRLAVYLKGKNAKNFKHNVEYGSARWGTAKDIEPFIDPNFENNIILTQTERLMMNNRPENPANARNKNVLIIGGSGSGKTRYFIKPNILQCTSEEYPTSFVVTDPKMYDIQRRKKSGIKFSCKRRFDLICQSAFFVRKIKGKEDFGVKTEHKNYGFI